MPTLNDILPAIEGFTSLKWDDPFQRKKLIDQFQQARELIYLHEAGRLAFLQFHEDLPIWRGRDALMVAMPEHAKSLRAAESERGKLTVFSKISQLAGPIPGIYQLPQRFVLPRPIANSPRMLTSSGVGEGVSLRIRYHSGDFSWRTEKFDLGAGPQYAVADVSMLEVDQGDLQGRAFIKDSETQEVVSWVSPRTKKAEFRRAAIKGGGCHCWDLNAVSVTAIRSNVPVSAPEDEIETATFLLWRSLLEAIKLHFKTSRSPGEDRSYGTQMDGVDRLLQAELSAMSNDAEMPEVPTNGEYRGVLDYWAG